uniref:Kazal-like domain-containing protein n=1 Tax=Glossina palpalis gambiensis TaxID=67801 RepID=A0A1B0BH97_9MUSC
MFSTPVICSLLLICSLCTTGAMGNASCNQVRTREHQPVCGTLTSGDKLMHCSFPNKCLLNMRTCKHHEPPMMRGFAIIGLEKENIALLTWKLQQTRSSSSL